MFVPPKVKCSAPRDAAQYPGPSIASIIDFWASTKRKNMEMAASQGTPSKFDFEAGAFVLCIDFGRDRTRNSYITIFKNHAIL